MLNSYRLEYVPQLPKILQNLKKLKVVKTEQKNKQINELEKNFPHTYDQPKIKFEIGLEKQNKPLRVGVVFSGGQAAGGHNVITGLFDALKTLNSESLLFGFLGGPNGITENKHQEITENLLKKYRNTGGFDLIGSGRTKIETPEQFEKAKNTVEHLNLDGLVIIGGDDSNTNAALLAEYFLQNKIKTAVVGVPKTIDGDLKNKDIEISFGFDTATKTFSEIIGNILRDSLSAKKYYFFIKIMGRTASHIALECALQTHPNLTLIGEEIEKENKSFTDLVNEIANLICERAQAKKNYGVIIIPEGIIEFIPEFKKLISELNKGNIKMTNLNESLSKESLECFNSLPEQFQNELLLDRDPHGNVQVSKIETERLFMNAVSHELNSRTKLNQYTGTFSGQAIFCGYEGRSCFPSNFDCQYCYALGQVCALLINEQVTGYMVNVGNLSSSVENWTISGTPLTSMLHFEERKGKHKPVIKKALVDLKGKPFNLFKNNRNNWKINDEYIFPGPVQFFGPQDLVEQITFTLKMESEKV